jgi:hypothetical protein
MLKLPSNARFGMNIVEPASDRGVANAGQLDRSWGALGAVRIVRSALTRQCEYCNSWILFSYAIILFNRFAIGRESDC